MAARVIAEARGSRRAHPRSSLLTSAFCLGLGACLTPVVAQAASQAGQPLRSSSGGAEQPSSADAAAKISTQGDLGHPYMLPATTRSRVHECGVEWQRMKLSGEAAGKTWRVFASVCLVDGPDPKPVGAKPGPLTRSPQ